MVKIRYSDEFICPKCGSHTALVCRTDGTYQAHCMICDVYYDVEIENATNADRIRSMTDEELAEFLCLPQKVCPVDNCEECFEDNCKKCIYEWLRKEAESEEAG